MRILDVNKNRLSWIKTGISILLLISFLSGCSKKPTSAELPDRVVLPKSEESANALWFTTTNLSTGGKLGRLDLKTGIVNRSIMVVGPDAQIFPDGSKGLFLLTRMSQDAVTALEGSEGKIVGHFSLPTRINPQMALRDSKGKVWVTLQESNSISVLAPDLKSQVGGVDLSSLKDSNDEGELADLAQIAFVDDSRVMISAQRLHRSVAAWKPDKFSGIAIVNTESLAVEFSGLLEVSNPTQIEYRDGVTTIAGMGDLSAPDGEPARTASFTGLNFQPVSSVLSPGKILATDISVVGQPADVAFRGRLAFDHFPD